MLEAPEAAVMAAQFNETIRGKRITVVMYMNTPHKFAFSNTDAETIEECLLGAIVGDSCSRGGMVEIEMGSNRLVFTDGANITYYEPGAKLPAKHQLLMGFDDESCIVVTVRMYGGIFCFSGDSIEGPHSNYYSVARNKIQVMSDDFTREYFMSLINDEKTFKKSAKAALATEQAIPGLGSGVLQDILYNAGIHPKTKIRDLSADKLNGLYDAVVSTLGEMAAKGGRNTESDLFGHAGGYKQWLSKDTLESPCPRCGGVIIKENYLGGSIYYCSECQK